MGGTYLTHRRDEKNPDILFKKLKPRTHSKFLGPKGRITLNYISNKQNVNVARTGSRYGPRDHNNELEDFINVSGFWPSGE